MICPAYSLIYHKELYFLKEFLFSILLKDYFLVILISQIYDFMLDYNQ